MKTVTLMVPALVLASSISAQSLENLLQDADAVVVGTRPSPVLADGGLTFPVTVSRVIKGDVGVADVLQVLVKLNRDPRGDYTHEAATTPPTCALYALRNITSGWLMLGSPGPYLHRVEISLTSCGEPPSYDGANTPLDRATAELLGSLKSATSATAGWDAMRRIGSSKSAFLEAATKNGSNSKQPVTRAVSLAWRIQHGDAAAMSDAAHSLQSERDPILASLVQYVVSDYLNSDPVGVHALGAIVQLDGQIPPGLQVQAANALRFIHTREAVPYLALLLAKKDPVVQEVAVSGLSEYIAGVRIAAPGPDRDKAFDESFNPARMAGRSIPNAQYLHVGPFRNPDEAAMFVEAWKSWWSVAQGQFPAAIVPRK